MGSLLLFETKVFYKKFQVFLRVFMKFSSKIDGQPLLFAFWKICIGGRVFGWIYRLIQGVGTCDLVWSFLIFAIFCDLFWSFDLLWSFLIIFDLLISSHPLALYHKLMLCILLKLNTLTTLLKFVNVAFFLNLL